MGLIDLLRAAISGESTIKLRDSSGHSAPLEMTTSGDVPAGAPPDAVGRFLQRADRLTREQWQAVAIAAQAIDANPAQASRLRAAEEHARAFARNPRVMDKLVAELGSMAPHRDRDPATRPAFLAEGRAAVALSVRDSISGEDFALMYGPFEPLIPVNTLEAG
jgi:hypothetical protein